MATFTQRESGYWQAKIRRKGHPVQSATFRTKAEAAEWARGIENTMDRGTFVDRREAEATTFRDALERYEREVTCKKKSQRSEKGFIKRWLETDLTCRSLASLRSTDFAKYRDERLKSVSTQTARHELKVVSHMFNIAAQEWSIPVENPLRSIKMPAQSPARERRLVPEEEHYLLKAAADAGAKDKEGKDRSNPWVAPIIRFALATAMRQGEILSLAWKDVDLKRRTAKLWETKNTENRTVPLSPAAIKVLAEIPASSKGKVFPTTTEALRQSWARCVARAKRLYLAECAQNGQPADPDFLEDLHFHDLRHEATSRFFELGRLDTMRIAKITGHKTLQMLKRYTHLDAADIADVLAQEP